LRLRFKRAENTEGTESSLREIITENFLNLDKDSNIEV
jgi:hypothetical protein